MFGFVLLLVRDDVVSLMTVQERNGEMERPNDNTQSTDVTRWVVVDEDDEVQNEHGTKIHWPLQKRNQ